MKKEERKRKDNIEKLTKEVEEKKKIPKEVKEKINSKVFENMIIAAIIMVYLVSLNFGMTNIPTDTYRTDLKVFSILLLIITIMIFEWGYKKDNESIWLHGVEVMILGVITLYLIYLYSMYYSTYGTLILSIGIIYLIYYAIKILIIQKRIEKEYIKSLNDIGEIIKK